MLRVNMNENVTVHKAPERQAAVQGQLSTGRVVGQNPVTAWIPGQMAGVSSTTFRRTIPPHSEAVHSRAVKRTADFSTEAARAKRPKGPETTTQPWQFKDQVDDAVRQLCDERDRNKPDHLSFCLRVVDTYKTFKRYLSEAKVHWKPGTYDDCRRYVISGIHSLYHENLDEVLNFFQYQVDAGCIWIYADKLDLVAQGFNALGRRAGNATNSKALLARIWNQCLNEELNYLKFLKGSPDNIYSARRTVISIKWLANTHSPACHLELISDGSRKKIIEQAESLLQEVIRSDMAHSDAGKKKEDVTHKTTDAMMEKRKHHDRILDKLYKLRSSFNSARKADDYLGPVGDSKCIGFLRTLSRLCEEYNELVNDPVTILFRGLNNLTTPLVNEVQNKLGKGAYDNKRELKEEALLLLGNLKKDGWLSRECKDPYSDCAQSQNTVTLAVWKSQMESAEFHEKIDQIFALVKDSIPDKCMLALEQIKQLHDNLEGKSKGFTKKELEKIQHHLEPAKKIVYAVLFAPILNEYKQHNRDKLLNVECAGAAMYCHKNEFVKLNSYMFIFNTTSGREIWQRAASCAWYHDLERLRYQTSFSENDVDTLLDLKDAAPTLHVRQIEDRLLLTLTNLFQSILQANPGTALIEKVTKLSEWIDDIDRRRGNVSQVLHEYNKSWREKYVSKGRRAITSSYALAARMPSSVPPGTLSVFPETFDCLSRMRLQNVPHAGQFSTLCPAVPTPAPFGAFQQSGSSIPCRAPIAQSVAGSRPFSPPRLINRPFLPRIPAPACNRADFRRPPVCGQIRPRWRQAESRQQYEPRRSAMPFEEYRSRYPFSSNTR